ncbi:MAG: serine protease [Rhizomicrobium sp.]
MRVFAVLVSLAMAGCAVSSGERATTFLDPAIAGGYIPLEGVSHLIMEGRGAAFVIAPGIAVTNAHNAGIIGDAPVVGTSRNYDLLFFRVSRAPAASTAEPRAGETVLAYGQGAHGELRVAQGVVRTLNAPVEARCAACIVQGAFTFEGNAGPGFSGGPVVDANTGSLVGITFGYLDPDGHRLMYAYPMSRVRTELAAVTTNPSN